MSYDQLAIGNNNIQVAGNNNTVSVYQYVGARAVDATELAAAWQRLSGLPLDIVPKPQALPLGSRMRISPNPLFVGREGDLQALARIVKDGESSTARQAVAVVGFGGLGKTQLASEFVHRYGYYFVGGVFWLNFSDAENIHIQVASCGGAGYLDLRPDFGMLSNEEQQNLVLAAWQSPLPRLLIFDNCEEEQLLAQWLPPTGGSRLLLTSRRANWDKVLDVHILRLGVLHRSESIALLRRHRSDLPSDNFAWNEIANELGDVPLALHLAGSFLGTYRNASFGTPESYLVQLNSTTILEHPSLVGEGATISPTGHDQNVARTFAISYEKLDLTDSTDLKAQAILSRAAFFAPGGIIPRSVLLATVAQANNDFSESLHNEKALARLIALGLLEEVTDGAIRMHVLLAAFVRAVSRDASAQSSVENVLLQTFRKVKQAGNLAEARPLAPHLRTVTDLAILREDDQAATLCNVLGNHLSDEANYAGAHIYLERALSIREKILGIDNPETALDLNDLGRNIHLQGDEEKALILLERALPLFAQKREFADLAATLDNLAQVEQARDNYAAAQQLYEQALTIRIQVSGHMHPLTAITLHNLGSLLFSQGDLRTARDYFEQSLAIREKTLAVGHPYIATSLSGLAAVLFELGDLAAAQNYFERALEIREKTLGPIHPRTLNILMGLSKIFEQEDDFEKASTYRERARASQDPALKASTSVVVNNLGYSLWKKGDYLGARRYYEEALAVSHGTELSYQDSPIILNNLGMVLVEQGEFTAAQQCYEQAIKIQQQARKEKTPLMAQFANNFGVLLRIRGNLAEARLYLEQALSIRKQTLGESHRDTATTISNLGVLLQSEGDVEEARRYFEQALSIFKQVPYSQREMARTLNDLGVLLYTENYLAQAQDYLEEALEIRENTLTEDHPDIATSLYHLGRLLHAQEDLVKARSCLERAFAICSKRFITSHAMTLAIASQLESLNSTAQNAS
jgi:tetratricopeptide (TPR) repeat protein